MLSISIPFSATTTTWNRIFIISMPIPIMKTKEAEDFANHDLFLDFVTTTNPGLMTGTYLSSSRLPFAAFYLLPSTGNFNNLGLKDLPTVKCHRRQVNHSLCT